MSGADATPPAAAEEIPAPSLGNPFAPSADRAVQDGLDEAAHHALAEKLEKLKAASALPEMSPAPRMNMELPTFKPIDTEFTSKLRADMAAIPATTLAHALVKKDWKVAKELVTEEAAGLTDIMGRLPLFTAITAEAPEDILVDLIKANPKAVQEKDKFGDMPLNLALKYCFVRSTGPQVAIHILEAYPGAAKEPDRYGDLPLNYAIERGADHALIAKLAEAHPQAVREVSKNGLGPELPLQMALRVNADPSIVELLLNVYPDAAKEKDVFGYLPLQVAVRGKAPPALIDLLKKHTPEEYRESALKKPNGNLDWKWEATPQGEAQTKAGREATDALKALTNSLASSSGSVDLDESRVAKAQLEVDDKLGKLKEERQAQVLNAGKHEEQ